jgi:hypothetical protein
MKYLFFAVGFWLVFKTRLYYVWSRFYRWAFERKYRTTELTQFDSLAELEKALGEMVWTQDPIKGVLDVVSSPQKVEYIWRYGDQEVGDCDEFAVYAADRIQDMISRAVVELEQPRFVSVNWFDEEGTHHGHNICIFFDPAKKAWGHIGNWFSGQAQMHFDDPKDIADWFAGDGQLIAFAIARPDLRGGAERLHVETRPCRNT